MKGIYVILAVVSTLVFANCQQLAHTHTHPHQQMIPPGHTVDQKARKLVHSELPAQPKPVSIYQRQQHQHTNKVADPWAQRRAQMERERAQHQKQVRVNPTPQHKPQVKPNAPRADYGPTKAHRLQKGETLMGVARKYFGGSLEDLHNYPGNYGLRSMDPTKLPVGTIILHQ